MSADRIGTLDADGATALPRSNGELVFEAPWHSRLFGAAVVLQRSGALEFEEFRAELIEEIQAWQRSHDPGGRALGLLRALAGRARAGTGTPWSGLNDRARRADCGARPRLVARPLMAPRCAGRACSPMVPATTGLGIG
jgi:hypothetical protein